MLWKTFLKSKKLFLITFIAIALLVFSGQLGNGLMFNIKTAFGYGGGGGGGLFSAPIPTEVIAVNAPLNISPDQKGIIEDTFNNGAKAELDVPKGANNTQTMYKISEKVFNLDNIPADYKKITLVGDRIFDFSAVDSTGNSNITFNNNLTIKLKLTNIPTDTKNLGVYYFDKAAKMWMLVPNATINAATGDVSFTTKSLSQFAVMQVPADLGAGLPVASPTEIQKDIAESASKTPAKSSSGQQQLAVGTLVKNSKGNIFIITQEGKYQIKNLQELQQFAGQPIQKVSDNVLNTYSDTQTGYFGTLPVGPKSPASSLSAPQSGIPANGTLIRGEDNRIYVMQNGKKQHIPTLATLKAYSGKPILEMSDQNIARIPNATPTTPEIAIKGKVYIDGSLLRGSDKKIYVMQNGKLVHIISLAQLQQYAGKPILKIDDKTLNSLQ